MGVRTYVGRHLDVVAASAVPDYLGGNWTAFIHFQEATIALPDTHFRIFAVRMIDEDDLVWRRILRNYKSLTVEIYNPELSAD
jgi:hypothetical protein